MPIKKRSRSVLKNIRKSRRRYLANLEKKRKLKSAIKSIRKAKSKEAALKIYPEVQAIIDKSVQDGIIKKNTAARYKSRLMRFINTRPG
uniref:Small ribosomal subunit protein bS20 n=1 Tax=candidate division WOR-3 bacterium TaxID=2052148 RepID=A0A7C4XG13_UNCW3